VYLKNIYCISITCGIFIDVFIQNSRPYLEAKRAKIWEINSVEVQA
jgi:hypothetical protein